MMKGRTNSSIQYALVDFLFIHLVPTLCVFVATLPFCFVVYYSSGEINNFDIAAAIIIFGAVLLQIISDQQMYNFRQDPSNQGKTMTKGLWRYSRHPNYLGEYYFGWWFYFVSWELICIFMVNNRYLVMYVLIGITSIDMMDKRSRERRSDFSDYESSTPRLFPRFVSRS